MPGRRPRHLRAVTGQEIARYRVRLSVPRATGWYEWALARGDFEDRLAGQAGAVVADGRIDSERRRGRDYVTVIMSMTVTAPDVAQALTAGWEAFRLAAVGEAGWDLADATAEVRPEARLRLPGEYTATRGARLFIVDLIARREITEAQQQRLDRYKQRRDEYIRELADSAAIAEPDGLIRDTEPSASANARRTPFPGGLR